ncbi:hypothetical protein SAMN02910358_01738 [Lachnospiraceae bacterium XBB1006]|nr:hypothetical protein SAMN02910358_01738 [Lachnospiraceae bacterium XBB1006]
MKIAKVNPIKMWFSTMKSANLPQGVSGLHFTQNADAATITNALKALGNGSMKGGLNTMTSNTAKATIEKVGPKIFQSGFRSGSAYTAAALAIACLTYYGIKKADDLLSKEDIRCNKLCKIIDDYAEKLERDEGVVIQTPVIVETGDKWIVSTSDSKREFDTFLETANYAIDCVAETKSDMGNLKKKLEKQLHI